jgi:hypothetical protein
MKRLTFGLIALVSACATARVDVSPVQNWRLENGEIVRISGTIESEYSTWDGRPTNRILTVAINGVPALRGPVSLNGTGEINSEFRGQPLTSICSGERTAPNWIAVRCVILINNLRTVTLTF